MKQGIDQLKLIGKAGNENVALVYILEMGQNKWVECVESVAPPLTRDEKWVLLVSTMFGCPIKCQMCDAGDHYDGKLSADEILEQIDFLIRKRYPAKVPSRQFKIQFSRMGEPALNSAVLDVLDRLPDHLAAPGLMPSVSTVAPKNREVFFERLRDIKNRLYSDGRFQMQFSIHTTNVPLRNKIIPVRKWDFDEIARYGERYYMPGDRKITLNFALADGIPVEPEVLCTYFQPDLFLLKITPINPTYSAATNQLVSTIDPHAPGRKYEMISRLEDAGYEVLLSIGEVEENLIGSNCGQFLRTHLKAESPIKKAYSYQLERD